MLWLGDSCYTIIDKGKAATINQLLLKRRLCSLYVREYVAVLSFGGKEKLAHIEKFVQIWQGFKHGWQVIVNK